MTRAHFVKKARKAVPSAGIKAGDSYYWWKFRYGGKQYSKTPPKRSQLTQSAFYSTIFDLQDRIGDATSDESLRDFRDEIVSDLESLRDDCQSSFDNIPESLQSGSSGELLQERIDSLDNTIEEFSNLDLDSDPEFDEPEKEDGESDADYEARVQQAREEAEQDHWDGLRDELQGIDIDAP